MWLGCLLALWTLVVVGIAALLLVGLVLEWPWLLLVLAPLLMWRWLRARGQDPSP